MTDFTTSPTDDGGAITPPRALDADGQRVRPVSRRRLWCSPVPLP